MGEGDENTTTGNDDYISPQNNRRECTEACDDHSRLAACQSLTTACTVPKGVMQIDIGVQNLLHGVLSLPQAT